MRSLAVLTFGSLCVASAVAVAPAIAQEYQGCFLVDATGQMLNLDRLCPSSAPLPNTATPLSASPIQSGYSTQQRVEVLPERQVSGSDDHWLSGLNMVRRYAPGQWSGYVLNRGPHGFEEPGGRGFNVQSGSSSGGNGRSSSGGNGRGSGNCDNPNDLDSSGRRCGRRAASERPGGR